MQRVMPDSIKTEAERTVQREFRKNWLIPGTFLALGVLLFRAELNRLPNRTEVGQRTVPLLVEPTALGLGSGGDVRVVGAWRLSADDPRFGGMSALVLTGGEFIGLTDSGVIARFGRPNSGPSKVTLRELPQGPGAKGFKVNRDSEALLVDPGGRGWWVAFENRDQLWLYDPDFEAVVGRVTIERAGLVRNRGIEGMISSGPDLLMFPERGGEAIFLRRADKVPIEDVFGWVSDAVSLPDGTIAILNRQATPIGLRNQLVILARRGSAFKPILSWTVPVGRLDNVEGLAAERMPGGGTRFWLVTDNNFQQRRPTLLIAVQLKPGPARRWPS